LPEWIGNDLFHLAGCLESPLIQLSWAANAFFMPAPLIFVALALDAVAGDPLWLPHPVVLIGRAISWGERRLRCGEARGDFVNGLLLAVGITTLAAAVTWLAIALCGLASHWLSSVVAVLVAWTTLAMRGLDDAAKAVELSLRRDDENAARSAIPALAGRDPGQLDRDAMICATVESIAENLSDGIVAPLFFLFAGGPVAAMAYKAINTLDSMVGYRDQNYLYFGRAAARIDDAANFIPARLSALCIAVASTFTTRRLGQALRTCLADARKHASPNAGFPESAMAGALGVQLGGDAIYGGEVEHRAVLGIAERELTAGHIAVARSIMRLATAIAFVSFVLIRHGVFAR
jgi:adenosylcobinamide-phosphate synthase